VTEFVEARDEGENEFENWELELMVFKGLYSFSGLSLGVVKLVNSW
jgi:hypothetical protein